LYGFKTPAHTKAAIIYNDQIKKARLSNEYPIIFDGDKIKFAYLKQPNPVQDTVIGALHILPKELGIHEYIDYGVMFDKSFLKPIDSILGVIGWEAEHRGTLDALF
jgi:DNA polymerase elongation subunit (family B)